MVIRNLPTDANEKDVTDLFAQFGTVRGLKVISDIFTGKCRGFAFVDMEGHEARAAIDGLNGKNFRGNALRVSFDDKRGQKGGRRR